MNSADSLTSSLAATTETGPRPPSYLALLIRVNLLHAWRKGLALREQSKLLTTLICLFLAGYAVLAFGLFYKGLQFAGSFPGLGEILIERMLFLLFACLFALLLLSTLIISYTNLFRNRETTFLLTMPVPRTTIFQWKFLESTLLASWAFVFLVAPLLVAYGLTQHVPWHFYPVTGALMILFIILPATGGAWLAVVVARLLDRRAFQLTVLALGGLLILATALWLKPQHVTDKQMETRVLVLLDQLLQKTRFAQFPWLPSYWLSSGIEQWAEGALSGAAFFGLVLLSHALFFGTLMATRMGAFFYEAASATQSRGSVLGRWAWFRAWEARQHSWSQRRGPVEICFGLLPGVPPDIRALLVKDARVFWRDTAQWGQTLVLFGLLAVYILNLRHFSAQLSNPFWIAVISYLNLGACALNLATLTTRFVYPQFSLEGKRLWIMGLAPLGLPRVLLAKFTLSSGLSLLITLSLIFLSCRMLDLDSGHTLYLTAAVAVMAFALNALAIGLGALYPNFREDNPSKIVSGFGGTFCLVLSFLYILASVFLLAIGSPWSHADGGDWRRMWACWISFLAMSVLLGGWPLRAGLRRVAQFEI